jgi:hypothetical protein
MRQLPAWIAHYNEVHPHKALGYRSLHRNSRKTLAVFGPFGGYNTRRKPKGTALVELYMPAQKLSLRRR